MGLEQRQIQSQKLILTPQLRQYLRLLQQPLLELKQAVEQELAENPVLEEISLSGQDEVSLSDLTKEDAPAAEPLRELDFQNKLAAMDRIDEEFKETPYSGYDASEDDEDSLKKKNYQESIIQKSTTLTDYLIWQLHFLDLSEEDNRIAEEIVGNIDEDGYLKVTVEELAQAARQGLPDQAAAIEKVLALIQTLDPPGVGARDLREALLIQISKSEKASSLARKIVEEHFALLEKKHFQEIARKLGVSEDSIKSAFHEIARLEPKPGRIFYSNEPITVVPDASVFPDEDNPGRYKIEIHQESVPRLKISASYRAMLKDKKVDAQTRAFLKSKIDSALWLIQAVAQRKSTLRSITEEIVKAQYEFFDKGFSHLNPLRLKDISERIGIHESTVSRAIAGKYLETPQGTIPYRSFFSNKMETDDGSLESQKSVAERIRQLITDEDKKKPLSDEKIVKILSSEGIKIARRTVAKYRDLLKILPTHLRKER